MSTIPCRWGKVNIPMDDVEEMRRLRRLLDAQQPDEDEEEDLDALDRDKRQGDLVRQIEIFPWMRDMEMGHDMICVSFAPPREMLRGVRLDDVMESVNLLIRLDHHGKAQIDYVIDGLFKKGADISKWYSHPDFDDLLPEVSIGLQNAMGLVVSHGLGVQVPVKQVDVIYIDSGDDHKYTQADYDWHGDAAIDQLMEPLFRPIIDALDLPGKGNHADWQAVIGLLRRRAGGSDTLPRLGWPFL